MSDSPSHQRRTAPTTRILCLGLDAAEPRPLLAWSAAGRVPMLKGLIERGSVAHLRPPAGFYISAVWPSLATASSPLQHGRFAGRQLVAGDYRVEELANADIGLELFWHSLAAAGRRVALVDVLNSIPADRLHGVQLTDWATHDPGQGIGFHCWQPELEAALRAGLPTPDRYLGASSAWLQNEKL
jgi:predicted AlkP superfamily phosphohydrolase/phosphomutase